MNRRKMHAPITDSKKLPKPNKPGVVRKDNSHIKGELGFNKARLPEAE